MSEKTDEGVSELGNVTEAVNKALANMADLLSVEPARLEGAVEESLVQHEEEFRELLRGMTDRDLMLRHAEAVDEIWKLRKNADLFGQSRTKSIEAEIKRADTNRIYHAWIKDCLVCEVEMVRRFKEAQGEDE